MGPNPAEGGIGPKCRGSAVLNRGPECTGARHLWDAAMPYASRQPRRRDPGMQLGDIGGGAFKGRDRSHVGERLRSEEHCASIKHSKAVSHVRSAGRVQLCRPPGIPSSFPDQAMKRFSLSLSCSGVALGEIEGEGESKSLCSHGEPLHPS